MLCSPRRRRSMRCGRPHRHRHPPRPPTSTWTRSAPVRPLLAPPTTLAGRNSRRTTATVHLRAALLPPAGLLITAALPVVTPWAIAPPCRPSPPWPARSRRGLLQGFLALAHLPLLPRTLSRRPLLHRPTVGSSCADRRPQPDVAAASLYSGRRVDPRQRCIFSHGIGLRYNLVSSPSILPIIYHRR